MKPFRFLDLPPELRNRVYEEILVSPHTCKIPSICGVHQSWTWLDPIKENILTLSRQVRAEALSIYYGCNTFEAHIHRTDFAFFTGWLTAIGEENRLRLRKVTFTLQDRWTCADGLIDLVRDLARISGIDKIVYAIDTDSWTERYGYEIRDGKQIMDKEAISETTQMLKIALETIEELRSQQVIGETKIRCVFEDNMLSNGFACLGCEIPTNAPGRPKKHYGHCSNDGVRVNRNTALDCGSRLSNQYLTLKYKHGPYDSEDEEGYPECPECGQYLSD